MTFSLLGVDLETGEVGIAISSSSPAVAARCAYVRAGSGVAASQNVTDPRLGPALLDALAHESEPERALAAVREEAPGADYRQLAVLDARSGRGTAWSGAQTLGCFGHRVGPGAVAAGNLLASEAVLEALVEGFACGTGLALAERLLAGLRAGVEAGGEAGPLHAAGLLIAGKVSWPEVDLRVDWAEDPLRELEALWEVFGPQREDYVTRALSPENSPAFGVPGDHGA